MISSGTKPETVFNYCNEDCFIFLDYDNFRFGLNRCLKNLKIGQQTASLFSLPVLLESAFNFKRLYVYSSTPIGEGPPVEIEEFRKRPRTVFRETLLRTNGSERKQEGLDIKLAVDALQLAHKNVLTRIIIASDDGDFLPLVEALVAEGVTVGIASFGNPDKGDVSKRLRDSCDQYIQIGHRILWNTFVSLFSNDSGFSIEDPTKNLEVIDRICIGKRVILLSRHGELIVPSRMITLILADWRFLWHARC